MNSFIASSVRRSLAADAARSDMRARALMFKPMLAEFGGKEKHMGIRGYFFRTKRLSSRLGVIRYRAARRNARGSSSSQWHTSSPSAESNAKKATAGDGAPA